MMKSRINVYARIRREDVAKKLLYGVDRSTGCDTLTLHQPQDDHRKKRVSHRFRFQKIFDSNSHQKDVFESIAAPIIDKTMEGRNGTIFAYGPTGSGKTYSLTGSHSNYEKRGLIPRTIEYIFKFLTETNGRYIIYLSFLEIYNETAFDLLNPKRTLESGTEELPRVTFLEDKDGRAQYKNLNVVKVCSERDAMKLLYMGDTRRTTAETTLNKCSSRSHCVFTFYIHFFDEAGKSLVQSKLNIVDLAGSERLSKLSLIGVNLSEAKYINLSLHYLEQVISALTETNRAHVPFRNSLLTFMLRDSLSNNGATTMLATLSVSQINYEETMATCKFAQRVAKVNIETSSNVECNSIQEIAYLKSEIQDLRDKLQMRNSELKLSKLEEDECRSEVENFLNGISDLECDDVRKIKAYFDIFKTRINNNLAVEKCHTIIKQKDEEIQILSKIVDKNVYHGNRITIDTPCALNKDFKKVEIPKPNLNDNLKVAKKYSSQLRELQLKIIDIRAQIEANSTNFIKANKLENTLQNAQVEYRGLLSKIESIKDEVENTPLSVKRTKVRFESKLRNDQMKQNHSNLNNVLIEAKASNLRRFDGVSTVKNQLVGKLNEGVNDAVKNGKQKEFNIHAELDLLLNENENYSRNQFGGEKILNEDYVARKPIDYRDFDNLVSNADLEPNVNKDFDVIETNLTKFLDLKKNVDVFEPNLRNDIDLIESNLNKDFGLTEANLKKRFDLIDSSLMLKSDGIQSNLKRNVDNDETNLEDDKGFKDFLKGVPLTGDAEIDEEIIKFYKLKFKS